MPQDKLSKKAPFSQYSSLGGAEVVWGSPTDPATYPKGSFDVVYDNNGKDLETCKPLIDHFKVGSRASQLLIHGSGLEDSKRQTVLACSYRACTTLR